ncbi:MAG: hypothetical protein ABEJ95_06970 [Candidatus Nanohalobium sp.]
MELPDLDELPGENAGKSMMDTDWYSDEDRLHYDIGENSWTYHRMSKMSESSMIGIIDSALEYLTEGESLAGVMEARGTRWAQNIYEQASEEIDEDTEEVIFHHENSVRRLEDPTPGEVLSATYNHYMNTGYLQDDFARGASSVAIGSNILNGGIEVIY